MPDERPLLAIQARRVPSNLMIVVVPLWDASLMLLPE